MNKTDGIELTRSIIEDAIVDSARGLRFTIENEGGGRIRYWLRTLSHLCSELHKLG